MASTFYIKNNRKTSQLAAQKILPPFFGLYRQSQAFSTFSKGLLKKRFTSVHIGQVNKNSLWKSTQNPIIQFMWSIGGTQDENPICLLTHTTVELQQKLGFHTSRTSSFTFIPFT
jgi:hypothetical protein